MSALECICHWEHARYQSPGMPSTPWRPQSIADLDSVKACFLSQKSASLMQRRHECRWTCCCRSTRSDYGLKGALDPLILDPCKVPSKDCFSFGTVGVGDGLADFSTRS